MSIHGIPQSKTGLEEIHEVPRPSLVKDDNIEASPSFRTRTDDILSTAKKKKPSECPSMPAKEIEDILNLIKNTQFSPQETPAVLVEEIEDPTVSPYAPRILTS